MRVEGRQLRVAFAGAREDVMFLCTLESAPVSFTSCTSLFNGWRGRSVRITRLDFLLEMQQHRALFVLCSIYGEGRLRCGQWRTPVTPASILTVNHPEDHDWISSWPAGTSKSPKSNDWPAMQLFHNVHITRNDYHVETVSAPYISVPYRIVIWSWSRLPQAERHQVYNRTVRSDLWGPWIKLDLRGLTDASDLAEIA
jgi:hypothetical protein